MTSIVPLNIFLLLLFMSQDHQINLIVHLSRNWHQFQMHVRYFQAFMLTAFARCFQQIQIFSYCQQSRRLQTSKSWNDIRNVVIGNIAISCFKLSGGFGRVVIVADKRWEQLFCVIFEHCYRLEVEFCRPSFFHYFSITKRYNIIYLSYLNYPYLSAFISVIEQKTYIISSLFFNYFFIPYNVLQDQLFIISKISQQREIICFIKESMISSDITVIKNRVRSFATLLKILFNNRCGMGGVCTGNENEKATIQCPHRKKPKKGQKGLAIKQEIGQNTVCQICREIKEMKGRNQQANFQQIRSRLSLTTHNQEEQPLPVVTKKSSKLTKKTISNFEVVRGLGKGAFGKVYLIKERQTEQPLTIDRDILSINVEGLQEEDSDQPEEIAFDLKIESQNGSENKSQRSLPIKTSDILAVEDTPKAKKNIHSSKLQTRDSRIVLTPRYYALKILSKNSINSYKQKKQAISERYILQAMDHPFIVKLHYAFQTKSRLFLIVDLMAGGELFYLLRKMRKFNQQMTKFYAAEILLALEYLHNRSIIYRDLKPQNILLDAQGHIKITDFGLSKVMYSSNQKTYSLCGTPEYMAPEVIMGIGYTQAADWFSYGSLIYDMMTGRPPFLNNNKSAMLRNLATKPVPLPYYFSDQAKSMLTGLFQIKPQERLGFKQGAAEIKRHKFFESIDFSLLEQRKIQPPVSFQDSTNNLNVPKEQAFLNSGGFEKWSSWHLNMQSPQNKRTKESGQRFEGFTYENGEDYEFEEQEIQAEQGRQLKQ